MQANKDGLLPSRLGIKAQLAWVGLSLGRAFAKGFLAFRLKELLESSRGSLSRKRLENLKLKKGVC